MLSSTQWLFIAGGAGLALGFVARFFHWFPSMEKYFASSKQETEEEEAYAELEEGEKMEVEEKPKTKAEQKKEAEKQAEKKRTFDTRNQYTVDLSQKPKVQDPRIVEYKPKPKKVTNAPSPQPEVVQEVLEEGKDNRSWWRKVVDGVLVGGG
uniref:Uncharacterized protein n=1 Tax=Palpitomonas bilix TaxID=652834 RepID=A0A7S3DC06_9EUKA|mmetsp:Transcript_30884/g.81061  ORF Transcript_30884/g.81061 Transcript_30884/m.81061 type:complete len:152 (+) Transcript_30884:1196-1651(+)